MQPSKNWSLNKKLKLKEAEVECFPSKSEVVGSSLTATNRMFNC